MPREILVVKKEELFDGVEFQGFCHLVLKDFMNIILEKFEYQERNQELENNPAFKQIIPYVWIVNPVSKKVFLYKRSTEGEEGRLHNKYSGGVGGHIDKDTEANSENPIIDAMMRELREEVKLENYPIPKFIGFLNDDIDVVGQVHFGVVAIAETEEEAKPLMHMEHGKFYTIDEVEKLISMKENELEGWSKFSWPFVKNYISNL